MDIKASKKRIRIKNALRSLKRVEAKTLPIHMIKRDTHKLLEKNVNNNKIINLLLESIDFNSKYEELLKRINSIIPSTIPYNYCISGSKAWYNIFKDYYDYNLLSEYEKSSIHNNNSCDHYYFINNKTTAFIKYINDELLLKLRNFISEIEDDLNKNVKQILKDDNKKVQLLASVSNSKYNKLLFIDNTLVFSLNLTIADNIPKSRIQTQFIAQPSAVFQSVVSQSVTVQPKPRAKRRTNAEIAAELAEERRQKEQVKQSLSSSRAARAAKTEERRQAKKQGGTIDNQIKKKILSFEINFRDIADDLQGKIRTLTNGDNRFLNIYGLFLFLQLAKIKFYIPRGVYNIFKIREHIYNKFILLDEYKTAALFTILEIYNNTFKDYNISNEYINNELNILALTSNPKIKSFIDETEETIIEKLRPYINKCIFDINEEIKTLHFKGFFNKTDILEDKIGRDYSGIFVIGGDAIRRYDNNGSITKDIDSKIYIPEEIDIKTNIENYKLINKCIYNNLFKLVSYLILNTRLFTSIPLETLNKYFSYTAINNYRCKASFKLKSDDANFLNFRFRQLPGNQFPVDLYSLDYRCLINFEYELPSGEVKTYIHNYDIAFIDIVLGKSQDNNYNKYAVISNNLPIGSIEFLIQDLIKTYNDDGSSLLRFINGKSNKDYDRFKLLAEISKRNNNFTINERTKIITYQKPLATRNNIILDRINDYERSILDNPNYSKLIRVFNINYDKAHDENYIVTKRIIFDYEKSTLFLNAGISGGSGSSGSSGSKDKPNNYVDFNYIEKIFNLSPGPDKEITSIKEPTDKDNYISYIMNPKKELTEQLQKDLAKELLYL
jgi:hypothetical protein